ncbi:MAG TPA: lysophospholipase [Ideonella sp.]|nr:lysophospholipase [Ideonella sp.]
MPNDAPVLTADGLLLHLRLWEPGAASRGQVLIVHGLGEHAGRYEAVAAALKAYGWRVAAYDQRGHGASEGERGVIAASDSLLCDLARVIDRVHAEPGRPPTPLILLGHSLGGLVAARFVAESLAAQPAPWARPLDALVLSSPALDAGMSPLQKLLAAGALRLAPDLALGNGLDPHWISRDPGVVQAYIDDPLVHNRISGRLASFIAEAGPQVVSLARQWRVPTLLMWAGADRCVQPAGSARFALAAPATVVAAHEWPGLAHELFNEPERNEVLGQLAQWLDRRFPPDF